MKPINDANFKEKVKSIMVNVQPILNQIAINVWKDDGGMFLPGFSVRVRAYTLDELAKQKNGIRYKEDVISVGVAMKNFHTALYKGEFEKHGIYPITD